MKQKKQQNRITALYCRLSRDDDLGTESMSIQSQKVILGQYAKDHGFTDCEFFVDDGYSGTNYDRPDFQRMIGLVEQGAVGTIIVKDLSRLGRNYLETGRYTEVIFPEYRVRFIAINDGVDSATGDNEFAPFKNIINEWYAKDISRKIKSAFQAKAAKGEFIGSFPPFGYQKSPVDKHKLIPDERAPYVKMMFQMALEGKSSAAIARALEQQRVLTPQAYIHEKFGATVAESTLLRPYSWSGNTVRGILSNQVYLGNMVHYRAKQRSFKDKRRDMLPKDEWVIVKNTHEALIDEQTFQTVQQRVNVKQPFTARNPDNIYRGLIYCGECGGRLAFNRKSSRDSKGRFTCAQNRRYGGKMCSCHYITLEQVNAVVLGDIRRHASLAAADTQRYAEYLARISRQGHTTDKTAWEKELTEANSRLAQLDTLLRRIYEDNVFGRLSDDRYAAMSASYEAETKQLKTRATELQGLLTKAKDQSNGIEEFARQVAQYTDITELSEELVHTLIERVVVHEKEKIGPRQTMRIEIYYRFIGNVDDGTGQRLEALKGKKGRKAA